MSVRPRRVANELRPQQLEARSMAQVQSTFADRAMSVEAGGVAQPEQTIRFHDLTPVEQAAASLGVQPFAYKPIAALNDAHYTQLQKSNVLSNTLMRRIEAFKHVAQSEVSQ